ncbi:MAG: superoxide dismutase [Cu-Zn] SodC [Pseudomonadota bacterium]
MSFANTSKIFIAGIGIFFTGLTYAEVQVPMFKVSDNGIEKEIGNIVISETDYGVTLTPALKDLPPGMHGFHLHQNPSCESAEKEGKKTAAHAAGSHYDPKKAEKHHVPWGDGHEGDLPALFVDEKGNALQPVLAPRLKMSDLKSRSLMIHAGSDNYSDQPAPLGGGGARIACGVIP